MKRVFCLLICLVLLVTGLPVSAAADSNPVPDAIQAVVCIISGIGYRNGTPYYLDEYAGQGTGFGIGPVGKDAQIFATNCHVVSRISGRTMVPYDTVYIFVDGADVMDERSVVRCDVLYADPQVDLAIIKAQAPIPGVATLPICSAEKVSVGETVYALGYPSISDKMADSNHYTAGDITVTDGVVSRHQQTSGTKCMAHTASVNHGNSGGPLINGKGQVIGINTFIYTDVENADKRNFAIYSDYIMEVMDELGLPYREEGGSSGSLKLPMGAITVGAGLAIVLAAALLLLGRKRKKTITVQALRGPLAGRSWQLKATLSIGRDPARDIVLPQDTKGVSRGHCVIQRQGDGAVVTDQNSTYGTFLDGRRLQPGQSTPLHHNAVLSLASDQIQFLILFDNHS